MTNRTATAAANQETASAAFATRKAEIDALIACLTEASENHFNADPETLNWGHVGNLETIAARLAEVAAFANA